MESWVSTAFAVEHLKNDGFGNQPSLYPPTRPMVQENPTASTPTSSPGEPALALRKVSKTFPGVLALDDVSFDVWPGEVHALLGENGAGKSTLIKIVSGVYPPGSGEMQVDGKTVHFAHPREAQAHGIATIYQEFSLYPELTVAENIFSGNMPRTMGGFRAGLESG